MTLLALAAAALVAGAGANISLLFVVADRVGQAEDTSAKSTSPATAAYAG